MRMLDLFSGIGGMSLAAEWAGIETVAFCEIEPYCQKVLRKHWPHIPIYDDVRQLTRERLEKDGVIGNGRTIDIVCGGYPCQPFSVAGKRRGAEDDRHLWPEMFRLIEELRPAWVVGENVAGHVSLGLDDVLSDLESAGYQTRAFVIPAAAVGAPHRRDRVFVVGYTEHDGSLAAKVGRSTNTSGKYGAEGKDEAGQSARASRRASDENVAYAEGEQDRREEQPKIQSDIGANGQNMANSNSERLQGRTQTGDIEESWAIGNQQLTRRSKGTAQPRLGGVLDGISARLDGHRWPAPLGQPQYDWEPPRVATGIKNRTHRLKALGNAVVPQQVYPIFEAIKRVHLMNIT